MPTKVKGLLKGLKCISHIFENKKEEELQIGFPTDVKHVAHIGGQGPSANAPSWMNEFDSTQQLTLQPVDPLGESALASDDMKQTGAGGPDLLLQNVKDAQDSPRHLLSTGFGSPLSSPSKHGSSVSKHLRRHRKSAAASDAPPQESSRSTRHSRRNQNLGLGVETPSHDAAMVSKQSRRRKSKGSSGGGSTRLRSKGQSPSNDASSLTEHGSGSEHGQGLKKIQSHLSTVTEVTEEGKG
ncbi:CRIB domain-containing protein RIC5-like [Rhodamnia argentea]|uniref:CRIB domain-containing protein RIC5-like n=1 Tax=Rhodamnia argentea TaxID=178133 RepID=A0ABM3GXU0_9MYRT|nr:CRIB domain-containing protein RIC5-like [Rhodamnia argentea]